MRGGCPVSPNRFDELNVAVETEGAEGDVLQPNEELEEEAHKEVVA